MTLPEVMQVGLSTRDKALMLDQLKGLYSWDFLGGLNEDQIIDLFEEMIQLPGLQHIKHEKPIKPRPDSNIYDITPLIMDDWWKPRPGDPDYEEEA